MSGSANELWWLGESSQEESNEMETNTGKDLESLNESDNSEEEDQTDTESETFESSSTDENEGHESSSSDENENDYEKLKFVDSNKGVKKILFYQNAKFFEKGSYKNHIYYRCQYGFKSARNPNVENLCYGKRTCIHKLL